MKRFLTIFLGLCICFMMIQPSFGKNNKKNNAKKEPQVTTKRLGSDPNGGNCAGYAQSQIKNLGHGLTSKKDKEDRRNSYRPKKNTAAIINEGPYGHVAVVEKVDNKGKNKSITIRETNYGYNGVTERKVTGRNMKEIEKKINIVGYIDPNKKNKK
ncbi:MAG: CHAP domain-containing protein [Deltaproteobacteria bacterium]|nr:CHAP domain-containing protein [Deltaproteobacteria bacterium]